MEDKHGIYGVYGTGGLITYANSFLTDKPTVCIGRKGTIDKPLYFEKPIWTVDTLFYSEIKETIPKFVYYLFQTIDWKIYNQSTGVPSLTSDVIEKIKVYIPNNRNEQIKITSLFSLLDQKLTIITSNIKTLKKYKEGLRKYLFSSINSKEFKRLKDIVSFLPKSKLSAGSSESDGTYPFYLSGDKIGALKNYHFDGCFIVANDGGEAGFRLTSGKFSYSDHCICFKTKSDFVTKNLYEYLDSIKKRITYIGFIGSGLKNIDRDYLLNIRIPTSVLYEKYSSIFDEINSWISNIQERLQLLLSMKRYLLKNMFI